MEAILWRGSLDHPISPFKSQIRNPRKTHRHNHPFISEYFSPPNSRAIGLLQAPPPFLSHSYPPYSLQQPPLLPLPVANRRRAAVGRGPANKKPKNGNNRTSDPSLTPKKSISPKKEAEKSPGRVIRSYATDPWGPDPKDMPKNATKVIINKRFVSSAGNICDNANDCIYTNSLSSMEIQVDVFSGSPVFTISPSPSSLPLPTFSLRPKLTSCRAEAASGIDAGATDDLRRLLRLSGENA